MVGWEMLSPASPDPANRRLKAEATTCLGRQSSGLSKIEQKSILKKGRFYFRRRRAARRGIARIQDPRDQQEK